MRKEETESVIGLDMAELLELQDADRNQIVIDKERLTVTLNFAYPYEIDLEEIQTHADLLHWATHLCEKNWMTTARLRYFIEAVAEHKCWNLWQRRSRIDVARTAGVYLLRRCDKIVYVGQSNDVAKRVNQHRQNEFAFDKVEVIEIANEAERRRREIELIREHKPPLNKQSLYETTPSKTAARAGPVSRNGQSIDATESDGPE